MSQNIIIKYEIYFLIRFLGALGNAFANSRDISFKLILNNTFLVFFVAILFRYIIMNFLLKLIIFWFTFEKIFFFR